MLKYTLTENQYKLYNCKKSHSYVQWGTGKGKTIGALAWWYGNGCPTPLVIVGPAAKMAGTRDWQEITGYRAYYTSYESFDKIVKQIGSKPKAIIFDESHNIKNFKTKRWQKIYPYAENAMTLWLSATPTNGELWELYTFISLIIRKSPSQLDRENTIWKPEYNFALGRNIYRRAGYRDDFKYLLSANSYTDLTPVEDVTLNVEKLSFKTSVEEDNLINFSENSKKLSEKYGLGKVNSFAKRLSLLTKTQNKLKLNFIKELDNEHIVIFTRSKSDIEYLSKELVDVAVIAGDRKDTDWSKRYLLVNIQAGSAGLEFTHSDCAVYWRPPVSYIDYVQSLGRLVRTGQKYKTVTYYMLLSNRFENQTYNNLLNKKDTVEANFG